MSRESALQIARQTYETRREGGASPKRSHSAAMEAARTVHRRDGRADSGWDDATAAQDEFEARGLGDVSPRVDLKQLKWMGDKSDTNPVFHRPWCVTFANGLTYALGMSRHGYVVVPTDACPFDPPPERAAGYPEKFSKMYIDYIERDISKSRHGALDRPLAALKKWAGPHGSGQWGTGKFRGGQIKGVHLNLELLSRVLAPFRGGEVEIVVGDVLDPIRIYGDWWSASLMPRRDGETPDEPSFEGLGPGQRVMFKR